MDFEALYITGVLERLTEENTTEEGSYITSNGTTCQRLDNSSTDISSEEYSSLKESEEENNIKRNQYVEDVCHPGSGDACTHTISSSSSFILHHNYYKYPIIKNPGIEEALLGLEPKIIYPDDGQELYLALCKDMSISPIRCFHRSLLTSKVDLSYYGVNEKGFRALSIALKLNKRVEILDLTDNWMSRDVCFHIGEMLSVNDRIKDLNLKGCRIGGAGAEVLFHFLFYNRTLLKLDVSSNQLGDAGVASLTKAIDNGLGVININLSRNNLTAASVVSLVEVLRYHNKVTHLDLSWNSILSPLAIYRLCEQLMENKHFKMLNLSWNALAGEEIGIAIRKLFQNAVSVNSVILNNNRLCAVPIKHIGIGLKRAKKLDTLDLSYNPLSPQDALLLLEFLKMRKVKLRCLLLDDVTVNEDFVEARQKILSLSFRRNAIITHGYVRPRMVYQPENIRNILLKRAYAIGRTIDHVKDHVDFAILILRMNKENPEPIILKDFTKILSGCGLNLDNDLIEQFAVNFPGPRAKDKFKSKTIDLEVIVDYIKRLWPGKKLPRIPPRNPTPSKTNNMKRNLMKT